MSGWTEARAYRRVTSYRRVDLAADDGATTEASAVDISRRRATRS